MTETRDLVAQLGIGAEEDGRPSPKKTPDNSGSSPRILVVEDEPTLARATNTGPFGYVVKPFKTTELNCAIEIALHRHAIESGLREANRALESFNYSIAHDLRSPLRGIDGFSAILIENHTSNLGPEGLDCLTRIRAGVERMRQLIDDLLHLARIARSDYCPQRVDLTEIATTIMVELQAASMNR